jgi:putative CocE/NonD family hydrolase
MRDGVTLQALVFLPHDGPARVPVVLNMTPYGIDAMYPTGARFAAAGLGFALMDCRGRGDSDGEFEMFEVDINDTVDAIDWLSQQSWCDGQVSMHGGSYGGINQWIAAKSRPPALKGIAPWGAAYPGIDVPSGGIPYVGHVAWYVLTGRRDTQWASASDSTYWIENLLDIYRRNGSVAELARECGVTRPTFERVLRDPFYAMRAMTFLPTDDELQRLDMPILSTTGHYDSTHPGTLYHFLRHEQFGTEAARRKHHFVCGPWHHAGMEGTDVVSGLQFGPQALLDLGRIRLEWYRWIFGLGDKPAFLTHRVMFYMAGAEEWRGSDSIEDAFGERRSWYLTSNGQANDIFHSGQLVDAPPNTPPDRFVADPFDTDIVEGELNLRSVPRPNKPGTTIVYPDPVRGLHLQIAGEDPTDQAFAYRLNGQGVIYHSPPVAEDFEIAGIPELELWLSIDTPDSDVVALLYELTPDDGQSILLWSNLLRLRYRKSWREPELAEPGVPFPVKFVMPKFMSRRVRKGSRLRLVVRSPASIQYQKNLNSGKPVFDERPEDARRCTVLVHHEPGRQTVLRLPIARSPAR